MTRAGRAHERVVPRLRNGGVDDEDIAAVEVGRVVPAELERDSARVDEIGDRVEPGPELVGGGRVGDDHVRALLGGEAHDARAPAEPAEAHDHHTMSAEGVGHAGALYIRLTGSTSTAVRASLFSTPAARSPPSRFVSVAASGAVISTPKRK